MQFKTCCVCGFSLPINIMTPIKVKHNGKIITVGICELCKAIKEAEAKRRPNETTH
jgi:hypothetical protein